MLWSYYCAQLRFSAPQRSSINSNLTRIWSQFGRGNRPRTEETARVHAPKKASRPSQGNFATPVPAQLSKSTGLFQVQLHIFTCLLPPPCWPSLVHSPLCWEPSFYIVKCVNVSPGDCPRATGDNSKRPGYQSMVPSLLWGVSTAFSGFCDFPEGGRKLLAGAGFPKLSRFRG